MWTRLRKDGVYIHHTYQMQVNPNFLHSTEKEAKCYMYLVFDTIILVPACMWVWGQNSIPTQLNSVPVSSQLNSEPSVSKRKCSHLDGELCYSNGQLLYSNGQIYLNGQHSCSNLASFPDDTDTFVWERDQIVVLCPDPLALSDFSCHMGQGSAPIWELKSNSRMHNHTISQWPCICLCLNLTHDRD